MKKLTTLPIEDKIIISLEVLTVVAWVVCVLGIVLNHLN